MFIVEKNSWMKDKGNLDSHSILVIYSRKKNLGDLLSHMIHLRRLCEPCVFTHTCKRKKENPCPLRPHPLMVSSATLHLINFYRGGHPKLGGCRRRVGVALQTAPDFTPTAFRRLSAPTF